MKISRALVVSATLASTGLVGCSSSSSQNGQVYSRARMQEYDRAMAASDRQPPAEAEAIAPLPGSAGSQSAVDRQSSLLVTPPLPPPGTVRGAVDGVDIVGIGRAMDTFVADLTAPTPNADIADQFVATDRERVAALRQNDKVRAEVAQFVQNWHAHYNDGLAAARANTSMATAFHIVPPAIADAEVAGGRLVPDNNDDAPNAYGPPTTRPGNDVAPPPYPADQGRPAWSHRPALDDAVVLIPVTTGSLNDVDPRNADRSTQKVADVKVHFRYDNGAWRIELPDSVDADLLAARLVDRLHELNANAGRWPASSTEAYRMYAGKVLSCAAER